MSTLFKEYDFRIGFTIKGEWNNKEYKIIDVLGSGENGVVYLVELNKSYYALKICLSYYNLSQEVSIIKNLNGAQELFLGFSIFDVDDFNYNGKTYSFYVMPYERGVTINKFLYNKTPKEYLLLFKNIVQYLSYFHDKGWVFGDVKPEHILINQNNMKISFVDFGGVTKINEGVKQYTEIYDRGSWRIRNRKADSHYDLFSLSMVFVQIAIGRKNLQKIYNRKRRITDVYGIIQNVEMLKYLFPIIRGICNVRLKTTNDVIEEIDKLLLYHKGSNNKWIYWLFVNSLFLFIIVFVLFIQI